jgi:hypothetical protein
MTEHNNAPTANEAEQPLSDDEMDGIAGGGNVFAPICPGCGAEFTDLPGHYSEFPDHAPA